MRTIDVNTVNSVEIPPELKFQYSVGDAVIIDVPTAYIVTTRPEIVATLGLLLTNVNSPTLLDDGSVKLNEISLNSFLGMMKLDSIDGITPIPNVAVAVLDVYIPDASCVAVIIVDPAVRIVTELPLTVATIVLLLVYVNLPVLLLTGFVKLNEGSLYFLLEGTTKLVVHVGERSLLTTNVAVAVLDVYIPDASCVAVITVIPAPTIVTELPLTVATFELLLVYVNLPVLLLTGFVKLNEGSLYFLLEGTTKLVVHVVVICILHLSKRNKIKNRPPLPTAAHRCPPPPTAAHRCPPLPVVRFVLS